MEASDLWLPGPGIVDATAENLRLIRKEYGREIEMLMKTAYLCNNASYEDGKCSGDPTEAALLMKSIEVMGVLQSERVGEIPFDAERKRMSTVNVIDGRPVILTKGALETVLPLCTRIFKGNELLHNK
jgi:sodium/potassium-transporting ATPase subunit alpha